MAKKPGYSKAELYADILNVKTAQPPAPDGQPGADSPPAKNDGTEYRQNLPSKNDGEKYRQNLTAENDGKIYRQNLPSKNGGTGRVHKIRPERHRVELRLDDDLYERLTAEAKSAGVTLNGTAKQIFNLYFYGGQ